MVLNSPNPSNNKFHPKIDKLQYIANSSNAVVIVISVFILDESVLQWETQINNYNLLSQEKIETVEVLLAILEVM